MHPLRDSLLTVAGSASGGALIMYLAIYGSHWLDAVVAGMPLLYLWKFAYWDIRNAADMGGVHRAID